LEKFGTWECVVLRGLEVLSCTDSIAVKFRERACRPNRLSVPHVQMILARIAAGESQPKGSNTLANSESMIRLVTGLPVSGTFTLNTKLSMDRFHCTPRALTPVSVSINRFYCLSRSSRGMAARTVGSFENHFRNSMPTHFTKAQFGATMDRPAEGGAPG